MTLPADPEVRLPDAAGFCEIAGLLRQRYDIGPPEPSGCLLDELVATILSQHTSDRNSQRAFRQLKQRYPQWSVALAAGTGAIADAIRMGGLAEQKAPRIVELLRAVPLDAEGEPSLDSLAALSPAEVYATLQQYGGVGPKTAACALLFAYAWPLFPVDTHVQRVSIRLGWARPGETADRIQARLMRHVPPDATYDLHMGMVRHGRATCTARAPRCADCVLAALCPTAGALVPSNEVPAQAVEGS